MSAEHVSWVYKFSPASGAVFQIHHAIADSVNDQHDHEFWMRLDKLATKARVNKGTARRAIVWLLDRGLLELGDGEVRKGASTSVLYRFLMPDDLPVVFDSRARKERAQGARGARPRARVGREEGAHTARPGRAHDAPLIEPKEEPKSDPKVEPKSETAANAAVARPELDDLCAYLAQRVYEHRGGQGKPAVTARWLNDMRLLVDVGELGVEDHAPRAPDRVRACIDAVFNDLAEPGRDGFCWANQIRSPAALREHWVQIRDAVKQKRKAPAALSRPRRDANQPARERLYGQLGVRRQT